MTRLGRQVDLVTAAFRERTGRPPEGVWAAPDRVSLIGEHTDYNDGFVLPVAIDRQVVAAAARRPDDRLRLWSLQGPEAAELHLADLGSGQVRCWAANPAGVTWVLAAPWCSNDDRSRPPPSSPEAPMRLLVTGGAGYIGGVVGAQLVETGHQVTVLDNLSKGHRWAVPDGARFFQGDLEDRALLHRMLADAFDGVLQFAALSLVAGSVAQPGRYYRNIVYGTLNLLDAMADAGVPQLVFTSTAAVYGQPEEVPIPETAPTRPTNPCGGSKLAVDQLISFACAAHGLAAVSLCYFNVAGASGRYGELHDPETHLIPIVLEAAVGRRDTVQVFGSDYPTRRHRRPRLHPRRGPRAGAPTRARGDRARHAPLLQPRQRRRVLGPRGDRGRPSRHRPPHPERGRPAASRGPPILVASSRRIHDELGWVPKSLS